MTFESIHEMHKAGLLKIEFLILGIPASVADVEQWLKDFLKLRNELTKNNAVVFESERFANQVIQSIKEYQKGGFLNYER